MSKKKKFFFPGCTCFLLIFHDVMCLNCIFPCPHPPPIHHRELWARSLFAAAILEAGAVKATTAGLENPRREGEGIRRGGRGGRQGWSRGGG